MDQQSNRHRVALMLVSAAGLIALSVGLAIDPPSLIGKTFSTTASTTSASAPASAPSGQMRGFSIQLAQGGDTYPYEKLLGDISATGANSVKLVVQAYQENCGSVKMTVDPARSPSDKKLKAVLAEARKDGMKTILMPIVLLNNPREGEWRGKIEPNKEEGGWDTWWDNYTKYILHYARQAQDNGVDILMVGSELISTETQTERWEKLIAQVREVYKGKLSYSANWDHYRPVKYWNKLDVVGMTSYYDLIGDDKPTREKLLESWAKIKQEIFSWQETVNRPIIFTEVGWPNQVTAAKYPWDYYRSQDKPDPQQQKLCFETFFETFGQAPQVAGVLVWEWCNDPAQNLSPDKDTGYCPKGKPAMDVIQTFFRNGTVAAKQ